MPGPRLRVFVATGTGPPFARLHAAVARLAADPTLELFVQRGRPSPASAGLPGEDRLPREAFAERLRWASVVVAHAGAGSLYEAFRAGHVPVAVPRLARFGEVVNDHQLELARALAAEGKALLCEDEADLPRLLRLAPPRAAERPAASGPLVSAVREALLAPAGGPRGGGLGALLRALRRARRA